MMIDSNETRITAKWIVVDGRVRSDESEKRIHALIATYLQEIGKDGSGWEKLYRDPADGRYWELTFPQSELQAGGPPELRCIDESNALAKYSLGLNP
jgi:hypothetical protein